MQKDKWTVLKIADYWRVQRNRYLVATYSTKALALVGLREHKKRIENL